ncbi:hypothetical protein P3X46_013825 [Hevea brasiliensis]|uniref:Uncharacterized protein n=1 Tax=Hevea brasiliensis TaxID=3981 RepID=A0ABQ9M8K6_HEVBR|nr:hypothetical protein P3X46_013825 [Hevea brasiliensis]
MAAGATEILLQCVFNGSISIHDVEIQRRPYHCNCKCVLHNLDGLCPSACTQNRTISFPKKQAWTGCSLSIRASKFSSHTSTCDDLSDKKREDPFKALSLSSR